MTKKNSRAASLSALSFSPATAPADDTTLINLSINYTDEEGSPVADMEVSWAVSGVGATLGSATTSTDENGLAINTLKSSAAGDVTVTASAEDAEPVTSDIIPFTEPVVPPQGDYNLLLIANNNHPSIVNSSVLLTLTVTDELGTVVAGVPVDWSIEPLRGHTIVADVTETDDNGQATAILSNGDSVNGRVTVTAEAAGNTADTIIYYYDPAIAVPYVSNSDNDVIDQYDLANGIQAMIVPPFDVAPGWVFDFYWETNHLNRFYMGNNFPWIIDVSNAMPVSQTLSDGLYHVFYSITDLAGNTTYSPARVITVKAGVNTAPTLLRPLITNLVGNTINYEMAYYEGVKMFIPTSAGNDMMINDTYELHLKLTEMDGTLKTDLLIKSGTVTAENLDPEGDMGIAIEIEWPVLEGIDNARGSFYYSTHRPGDGQERVSVVTGVFVDTVAPHLI
ncbi:Ig-like domain-containing protein [Yersinia proxima]|uniref:Ig-like domain-containing protein n=1 Tax=Yersinia proxima TaxID=2890316 RepID=UPI001D1082D7|nr:Ig-like domain-containing protein [Yersinia proxima]